MTILNDMATHHNPIQNELNWGTFFLALTGFCIGLLIATMYYWFTVAHAA